ncbi:MAG TPA: ABC transporter substrate-binding protein [Ideonella sp.]|nr:ABC transporter substrate-binding protein [Ideonella sp.]
MIPKSLLALLLAAGAVLPAAAQSIARVSLNADIRSTHPGVNRDDNTDAVVLHMVEGLVAYREDASVGPLLADRVDVSADGLSYTFRLRDGIKFHNGATLSAGDVVWTWKHYLDPRTGWRCLPEFDEKGRQKIESVTAPDARTVVFKLAKPSALLLSTMARTDCGGSGIVHRDSMAADGSWKNPIGTGPFRLKEWKRGEYVLLERFPEYSSRSDPMTGYTGRKQALVDQVRFMVVPDMSAARSGLLAGSIDVMSTSSAQEFKELSGNAKVVPISAPSATMQVLLFQTRDPLLSNVKLRQAIAAAIDTAEIATAVTEGRAGRNNSVVATASPYYGAVQKQGLVFDPNRAKALLREAGYKGQPIKLITNKRYAEDYDVAILAQSMLQAAGVVVELEVMEWASQLDRYSKGNYQMMAFGYSSRLDPALAYDAVMGSKERSPNKAWDNPEAQALLAKSFVSADPKERQAVFDELHRRMLAEVPLIMVFNRSDYAAHGRNVTGFKAWVTGKPRLWDVKVAR